MTNTCANIKLIEPAHAPDALSISVVGALTRKMSARLTFGPIKTLAFGLVSGGLIPLLVLPKFFRDFVIAEQSHLWHFAEWLRLQFPSAETEKFQESVGKLRFRWWPYVLSMILAVLALLWAWSELAVMPQFEITLAFLFNFTSRLPYLVASVPRVLIAAQGFTLLLVAAHVLSVWQIVMHVRDVDQVMQVYNAAAKKHGMSAVVAPGFELQWTALWIVCMLAPAIVGAWWCLPMTVAASAQWRYINRTGRHLRLSLAAITFNVLASRAPHADVMLPKALQGKCVRTGCDNRLRVGSSFCPRCGNRVVATAEAEC